MNLRQTKHTWSQHVNDNIGTKRDTSNEKLQCLRVGNKSRKISIHGFADLITSRDHLHVLSSSVVGWWCYEKTARQLCPVQIAIRGHSRSPILRLVKDDIIISGVISERLKHTATSESTEYRWLCSPHWYLTRPVHGKPGNIHTDLIHRQKLVSMLHFLLRQHDWVCLHLTWRGGRYCSEINSIQALYKAAWNHNVT